MNIHEFPRETAQPEEGVLIPIRQKNGAAYLALDGTLSTITVVGVDADRYAEAERLHAHFIGRLSGNQAVNLEVTHRLDCTLLASAVIDWHGWDDGKKELSPTSENVGALLLGARHIFDQVQAVVDNHGIYPAAPVVKKKSRAK